jgi:hypothetical protein
MSHPRFAKGAPPRRGTPQTGRGYWAEPEPEALDYHISKFFWQFTHYRFSGEW